MTVLVFGPRGYIGSTLLAQHPSWDSSDADIADRPGVRQAIRAAGASIVINCAGKTGRPNIDWCELHPRDTYRSNVLGPLTLLDECLEQGVRLVHVGSGCIYDGDIAGCGFNEDDPPNFDQSVYSRSKALADRVLKEFPSHALIVRIRMPFDGTTHARNLLTKLLSYRRVVDAPNSMTYLPDFDRALTQLMALTATGVFNVVNPGVISPFEIAETYCRRAGRPLVERLAPERLSEVVRAGRSNCRLNVQKLEGLGIILRPVAEAVQQAVGDRVAAQGLPV